MTTLILQPNDTDALLAEQDPTGNYGSNSSQVVAISPVPYKWNTIFKVEIVGLPSSAIVSAATLEQYYYSLGGAPAGNTISVDRLRRYDWVESEATWNIYKTGNNWGTAGALNATTDYDSTNRANAIVPAGYGWMSWNILNHVTDAIANRSNILNFLIRMTTGADWDKVRLYSEDYVGDTSLCPKVTITYTADTLSSGGAGAVTGAGILLLR